ncbi:MAG: hypothetical protein ABR556_06055 [Pyrinomonadaceae bacterium]
MQAKPPNLPNKSASNPPTTSTPATEKPTLKPAANPPSTSTGYPAVTTAQPAPNVAPTPAVSSSGSGDSPITGPAKALSNWFSARRLITILAPLVLLGLILFFVSSPNRRRTKAGKSKRVKASRVEPKYATQAPVNEGVAEVPLNLGTVTAGSRETINEVAASFKQSERSSTDPTVFPDASQTRAFQERADRSRPLPEPATASSMGVGAPENHVWVLTEPTIGSAAASANQSGREEQEREVFEL